MRLLDFITERRQQQVTTMYHGTSSVYIRSILKQGLLAEPPQRTYAADDGYSADGYETFGGVYLSTETRKALAVAEDVVLRVGGDPIIVVVQWVRGSGNLDEDHITHAINQDLRWAVDQFYEDQEDSEELGQYDSFTEYERANRKRVINSMVFSSEEHFMRFGKLSRAFLPALVAAFTYILDNVEEEIISEGLVMSELRNDPDYVRIIQTLMGNVYPQRDNEATQINIQVTRDIGFRGKTKVVRIEDATGSVLWTNPNAAATVQPAP